MSAQGASSAAIETYSKALKLAPSSPDSANQLARALLALNLPRGATVGIVSRNLPEYGVAFFGVARSGLVLTNVSVLYAPDELTYVLVKARVRVLIFDTEFADKNCPVRT